MQRDHVTYLKDILEAIQRIQKYTQPICFEDFSNSQLHQDAVVRNLEIIGETRETTTE